MSNKVPVISNAVKKKSKNKYVTIIFYGKTR